MDEGLQAAGVPLITTIVFGALYMYKVAIGDNEKLARLTPMLASVLGAILGVISFYSANSIMPASDILTAILVGSASGLAATGTHQIYKQLSNKCEGVGKDVASTQSDDNEDKSKDIKDDEPL